MIGVAIALALILWVCLRRTGAAIALCFLLVGFIWRLVGAAFLDAAGPIASYEAEMLVGGDTFAADSFGLLIAISVLVMLAVMRPASLQAEAARLQPLPAPAAGWSIGDLAFGAGLLFVLALYADMFRIGSIPLLQCIERYEYLDEYAGVFHKALFKYGSLIALQFGTFAVYPRLVGGRYDWRFIMLVAALFIYLPLTGNRFSAFYSFTLFFLTPYCFVWLLRGNPRFADQGNGGMPTWLVWLLAGSGAAIVGLSLLNSYANIRYEGSACAEYWSQVKKPLPPGTSAILKDITPSETQVKKPLPPGTSAILKDITPSETQVKKPLPPETSAILKDIAPSETLSRFITPEVQKRFSQRILVQPIHMYFFAYERVIGRGDWQPAQAASFIFAPERKADGNRSIRYLMNRTLPAERAAFLESVGNQFAGGYPEVLLELLGKWGVWIGVVVLATITGWLLRFWMLAVLRGRFVTAFFAAYVYYAFVVMYVGGMLNFLVVWTFWAKVALLVFFAWLEPWLEARGRSLLPWRIGPTPRTPERT
jgi:hypothetical protein